MYVSVLHVMCAHHTLIVRGVKFHMVTMIIVKLISFAAHNGQISDISYHLWQ